MMHFWQAVTAMLPLLLILAGLTLVGFVLDSHSTEDKW